MFTPIQTFMQTSKLIHNKQYKIADTYVITTWLVTLQNPLSKDIYKYNKKGIFLHK